MPNYYSRSIGMNEMYCDLQSRGIKRKFVDDDEDSGNQSLQTQSLSIRKGDITSTNTIITTTTNNNQLNVHPISSKLNNNSTTITVTTSTTTTTPLKATICANLTSRLSSSPLNHQNLTVQQCFVRHRQQIFNISMCKLNRFRQSPDPSLLRSVLICNTLRTLERELDREGVKINFGPNGVSFIPPVMNTQSMTLDPPPTVSNNSQTLLVNLNNNNCNNNNINNSSVNNSNNNNTNNVVEGNSLMVTTSTSSSTSRYLPMCVIPDTETDSLMDTTNGDYDKYLMDLDTTSGRVTPFQKSLSVTNVVYDNESSSLDFTSNSLSSHSSANSAFWGSDEASDRLTSINWSSVLNFNSSVTTCSASTSASKTSQLSANGHQSNATNASDGSVVSTDDSVSPLNGRSSVTSNKSNTCSFTTLLPPTTSSSSTVTPTITTNTTSLSTVPSLSSTISQNLLTTNVTNSHTVINGNSISFSSNSLNDEIFGDIDLSLYDFDLLSPLSPPNVKLTSITAEELIRTISSTETMCSSLVTTVSSLSSSSL
ncbi:myosin-G heavy chain-like [Oppia nitens]|uniref:myosin-G heavy chain-like n=1 Tax=Oppia nitens TaxID=1686743 RepID=UPI0023DA036C|nr:myosin-G heavy chain-like [Oppia nitens]